MSEYLPGEAEDMARVLELAERWGYGRLIQVVQNAWSRKEQQAGCSRELADTVSGLICVWCKTDRRTGAKAGERFEVRFEVPSSTLRGGR